MKLTVHPIADRFPLMEGKEFEGLVADIRANRLRETITLSADGKMLIDGRNRLRACEKANVQPRFKKLDKSLTELDIIKFIISRNIKRRHLNPGQRAMLALHIAPALEKAAKERLREGQKKGGQSHGRRSSPPKSGASKERAGEVNRQLAEMFGLGHSTIGQAKKVATHSSKDADEVLKGTKTLNEAYKEARGTEQQSEVPKEAKLGRKMGWIEKLNGERVPYPLPLGLITFNRTNEQVSWAGSTSNVITGCLHNCLYCLSATTPILMADGRAIEIQTLRVGDRITGTQFENGYRRLVETEVLAHWKTIKPAYEIMLDDGRKIICSSDHRWLTNRGWKHAPHLTPSNHLLGYGPSQTNLEVVSVRPLGIEIPMFDITTGTEDFIANGVVSHNCYAREAAVMNENLHKFYPLGFEPVFHEYRLAAFDNSKVPKEAEQDPRLGRVFHGSMSDYFGKWIPNRWLDPILAKCREHPEWEHLFLTKFPQRYVELELPPTAWTGTTVDEQYRVKIAEEAFRKIKGVRVKWLSCEPLREQLKFTDLSMFDWVVIGAQSATEQPGEDGKTVRVPEFAPPFEWVMRIVEQARKAGCGIYMKPNLLGNCHPQSAGMKLIQEPPRGMDIRAISPNAAARGGR